MTVGGYGGAGGNGGYSTGVGVDLGHVGPGGNGGPGGSGGGIYNTDTLELVSCTIALVGNTVVALNTGAASNDDVFGAFASQGHNLVGTYSSGTTGFDVTGRTG